eukprot:264972-Chlamydomonas_euryale.AAC.9
MKQCPTHPALRPTLVCPQVYSLEFSHDERLLFSGSGDGSVRLWSPELGCGLAALRGHLLPVWSLASCPQVRQGADALSGCGGGRGERHTPYIPGHARVATAFLTFGVGWKQEWESPDSPAHSYRPHRLPDVQGVEAQQKPSGFHPPVRSSIHPTIYSSSDLWRCPVATHPLHAAWCYMHQAVWSGCVATGHHHWTLHRTTPHARLSVHTANSVPPGP